MTLARTGLVLLTDDGLGIAELLAGALAAQGCRPVVLGGTGLDLADGAALTSAVRRARHDAGPVRGVVHLASVGGGPDPGRVDLAGWRDGLRRQVRSLFLLARAEPDDILGDPDSWLVAVTGSGGDPATATDVASGGVAGLTRALAEEAAGRVRLVHLPSGERRPDEDATTVLREIERLDAGAEVEVGYADGRRLRPSVAAAPLAPGSASTKPLVPPNGVVLLTGGARGITAQVAHELAGPGTTLVLVGRSPAPTAQEPLETADAEDERALRARLVEASRRAEEPFDLAATGARARRILADREARATLASLRAAGATVDYRAADLRHEDQVVGLLRGVQRIYGRLDGVVHGAGVLDDGLLRDKSAASFDHVFHTKADSAFLLARHLDPEQLRFLVLFGSVAGRFGNAGQTDYAAANEVLAALARRLDGTWPGRVVAMCWGPWAGVGMVTPEVERRFLERGVEPITPWLGRRLFREELERGRAGDPVVVLGRGPWATAPGPRSAMPLVRTGSDPFVVETLLDPATDPYLDDHRLDGAPVLPAAVAAELIAEAAELAVPGLRVTELRDLSVLQGVVLEDGRPTTVRIGVAGPRPLPGGGCRCLATLGREERAGWSYRATVLLAPTVPEPSAGPDGPHDEVPQPPDSAYDDLLFHGPLFQGLESVTADAGGWWATVRGVPPERFTTRSPGGSWVLDPSLLDLGPQLAILWSRASHGTTTLPVRIGSIRRGRAVGGTAGLRLRFRVRPGADAGWQVSDAELRNADDSVRLVVTGLEAAGAAALNRLAGSGAAR